MRRRGRGRKKLLAEFGKESTSSHSLENSLWKKLWTNYKTEDEMNMCVCACACVCVGSV